MSLSTLFGRVTPGLVALALLTFSSASLTGQGSGPPAAPTNLASQVVGSTVSLSWQNGGGSTLAYQIEVGSAPGANNLLVTRTPSLGTVATAVPNGRYFVRVYALNAAGMSGPSTEIAVVVGCSTTAPAPTGLNSQVSGDRVTLSWQPVPGALGYQVEAGSTPGLADLAVIPVSAATIAGVVPPGEYHTRVRAVNACGAGAPSNEVVVAVGVSTAPIWGKVDPIVLGTCTEAVHDRYAVDGGDGYRYRTWHAQRDPSGCVFAHEHGDDPNTQTHAAIRARRVRFGYVGRRHPMPNEPLGHEEAHEGFKVFVANRNQRNDEGRVHLHDVRLVFHMGTGGPKRFATQHHSLEYAIVTNDGRWMFVQTMADTGGVDTLCVDTEGVGKSVVSLGGPCQLNSLYEFWALRASVHFQGRLIADVNTATAVFDPITVLDPVTPTRLVYIWDPLVNAVLRFPGQDRTMSRGCDREAYHGPSFWYNGTGRTTFYTDGMGQETTPANPLALRQEISPHSPGAQFIATNDGLSQFKLRRAACGLGLGLKN